MNVPALSAVSARLPQTYESAKAALAECNRINECQDWADKAEALASYARQANDNALRKLADRIQARAVRRAGELLELLDGRGDHMKKDGAVLSLTRAQAARRAGMGERQRKTAVRVARVPVDDFEKAVESENPPTVTKLADLGRTPRPGFMKATHLLGAVGRFAEFCQANEPEEVAQGVMPSEVAELRSNVARIDGWLDRFVINLEG